MGRFCFLDVFPTALKWAVLSCKLVVNLVQQVNNCLMLRYTMQDFLKIQYQGLRLIQFSQHCVTSEMWCYPFLLNKQKNNNNLLGVLTMSFSCFKAWWMKLLFSRLYTAYYKCMLVSVSMIWLGHFSALHTQKRGNPTIK